MENVMIDLETMGTGQNSLIVSIGATFFDPINETLGQNFYQNVDWQSGIDFGLEMDVETVKWWLTQSEEARKALFDKDNILGLAGSLLSLTDFLANTDISKINRMTCINSLYTKCY